ncbi:DUF2868 domain-containing protein [Akkermansiaceae bacterium]|nr:DUF2868 domain-containing protein [Akkermansiaceae bacterium]
MDFEALAGRGGVVRTEDVRAAVKGLEGAEARRAGMRVWLDGARGEGETPGEVWEGARFLAGVLVGVVMLLAGVGVMTGMLDRGRMGFHVPMVLGVAVGLPLLVMLAGGFAWVLRVRFSKGLGFVPRLLGWLVGKLGGAGKMEWWRTLRQEGGRGWEALGWNLVRLTQAGAVMFSLGLMAGLLGCIWFMEVGFFWESTTPGWMAARLHDVSAFVGLPWGWLFPDWVPGITGISLTQHEEGVGSAWRMQSAATWYPFLFAAIFVWGLLPRGLLWVIAVAKERKALGGLDFQAKRHRELWREIMGTRRSDVSEAPLDGVLVLDVGGTGLKADGLRGFLLRRLRVNPGDWFEVGVWDGKGEEAAAESIRKAPAGVVLLSEGWALSPPRMKALHSQIRALAGAETMIHFLVANAGADGNPAAVKPEEMEIWRDFVDGLEDAAAEIFFYGEGGL